MRFFLFISLIFLLSCNNNSVKEKQRFSDSMIKDNLPKYEKYVAYELPLPIEIFKNIKKNTLFNILNLAKPKDAVTLENWRVALFLGIYSADLAYITEFSLRDNFPEYTHLCATFSERLGIPNNFGYEFLEKVEKNIDNKDSVVYFTTEAYYKTCKYLDEKESDNLLYLTIYGGWLETFKIVILNYNYDPSLIDLTVKDSDKLITFLTKLKLESSNIKDTSIFEKIIEDLKFIKKNCSSKNPTKTVETFNKVYNQYF